MTCPTCIAAKLPPSSVNECSGCAFRAGVVHGLQLAMRAMSQGAELGGVKPFQGARRDVDTSGLSDVELLGLVEPGDA